MNQNMGKFLKLLIVLLVCFTGTVNASELVANPENSDAIDKEMLKLMLTGRDKFWESGSEVVIVMLKSDPEAEAILLKYSGMTNTKFRNHWQRMAFSGRGKMPKVFSKLEDALLFIAENKGAIGIVPSETNVDRFRRIDLGMRMVNELPAQMDTDSTDQFYARR